MAPGKKQKTQNLGRYEPTPDFPKIDEFPIAAFPNEYKKIAIDPWKVETLTPELKTQLQFNINLMRDSIVAFTTSGSATGFGGHTGGAFDTVPECAIVDAFFRGRPEKFVPIFYDSAGHRVATQYARSALNGHLPAEHLFNYRREYSNLPGHPELGLTPGIEFSSGRLGHMQAFVNGVALANRDKILICLSSDGTLMEGGDDEAAKLAVGQNLKVKLFVDDNNVTITGHPSDYLPGFDTKKTLEGHGFPSFEVTTEALDQLYQAIRSAILVEGPAAVVVRRKMAPGFKGIEGTHKGHDVSPVDLSCQYLKERGHQKAIDVLLDLQKNHKAKKDTHQYLGSSEPSVAMRAQFGDSLKAILGKLTKEERIESVICIDSDVASSTSLNKIQASFPEVFVPGGIMERGNFSACAGFGSKKGKQGIFSTFGAFQEMIISEISMARMNHSNVLCHFSHCGVDDMADNSCHFGINQFFADNGLEDQDPTWLYMCADANQLDQCLQAVYKQSGLRFIYTLRSKTPTILDESGKPFYGAHRPFVIGKDDVLRDGGADGVVISFGDAVYRTLDAVDRLRKEGKNVLLLNKSTLNVPDKETLAKIKNAPFLLIVEPFNKNTGLASKIGTWLLREQAIPKKFDSIGVHLEGSGGLTEQHIHQGYGAVSILEKIKSLL